jgi:hypothetical protein
VSAIIADMQINTADNGALVISEWLSPTIIATDLLAYGMPEIETRIIFRLSGGTRTYRIVRMFTPYSYLIEEVT